MPGPLSAVNRGAWPDIHRSQAPHWGISLLGTSPSVLQLGQSLARVRPGPMHLVPSVASLTCNQWEATQGFDGAADLGMPQSTLTLFCSLLAHSLHSSSRADHRVTPSHPLHPFLLLHPFCCRVLWIAPSHFLSPCLSLYVH